MRVFLVCLSLSACSSMPASTAVDLSKSSVSLDKASAIADQSDTVFIEATLRTSDDKPVARQPLEFLSTGSGNSIDSMVTTDEQGRAKVGLRTSVAEEKTVTVKLASGETVGSKVATFVAGPLALLEFKVQPSASRVGQPIRPAPELAAKDSRGNVVSTSDITVSVRLVRSSGGVVSGGQAQPIRDGGVVFGALTIDRAQTGYALRAEASNGNAVESATFDVTP